MISYSVFHNYITVIYVLRKMWNALYFVLCIYYLELKGYLWRPIRGYTVTVDFTCTEWGFNNCILPIGIHMKQILLLKISNNDIRYHKSLDIEGSLLVNWWMIQSEEQLLVNQVSVLPLGDLVLQCRGVPVWGGEVCLPYFELSRLVSVNNKQSRIRLEAHHKYKEYDQDYHRNCRYEIGQRTDGGKRIHY